MLDLTGAYDLPASQEVSWNYILDISTVATCIPGMTQVEELQPGRWHGVVSVGVGIFKMRFGLTMTIQKQSAPEHMVLEVDGRAPGSKIHVVGSFNLAPIDAARSHLSWQARVDMTGTLAKLGTRALRTASDMLVQQFFRCLSARLRQLS